MLTGLARHARRVAAAASLALLAQAAPGGALAQAGSERPDRLLEGINLAVVMPPEMGSNPANRECGVTEELVTNAVVGPVVGSGLRTERLAVAAPFTVATPGLYLIPTVATLREGRYMCISWVALRAQSAQPVTLPSTGLFRNAQILHWERGILVSSAIDRHPEAVASALQELANGFGQQWRTEQR
ncbi:hypothetical protein [Arenibaculum pallidiluteum]|uniref:hypothetical protein n=1 Tax=Arenibaculum pallidiluteum TaxID=2812559 RepID=UPI001A96E24B|nr:hypothetical protein [Arenibaculum pallidiluteum]